MATFTKSCVFTSDTQPHYENWALAFGQGFTAMGWLPQTGHGEIPNNGLTGASYNWSNTPFVTTTTARQAQPQQAWNFRGTWVSGTTYTGVGTTINQTSVDVVISPANGNTYLHVTASAGGTTDPSADDTNWMPFNYEIFKSNGANTGTLPVYIRVAYVASTTANQPAFLISMGQGIDASGNVTLPIPLTTTAPTSTRACSNASTVTNSVSDCDFSGDADNIRFCMWKTAGLGYPMMFCADRAKTSTGTDSDAYVYVGHALPTGTTTGACYSVISFKPALGGNVALWSGGWSGVITTVTSTAMFGGITPCAIFPTIGYLANPCLGLMAFAKQDVAEGAVVPVWIYGASHNYLVIGNISSSGATPDGQTNTQWPAMLWE